MKNHIAIKFIAIVLCAAALAGAVGSGLGIALLTGADLYNNSVEAVLTRGMKENGPSYAEWLAWRYAGKELGGCSESMLEQMRGSDHWFDNVYYQDRYGYAILDAEGQVLESRNEHLKDAEDLAYVYSAPAEGQYMYLVSEESETAAENRLARERMETYGGAPVKIGQVEIPAEGVLVNYVAFVADSGEMLLEAYQNGGGVDVLYYGDGTDGEMLTQSYFEHSASGNTAVGFLMFDQMGRLSFHSLFADENMVLKETRVTEAVFHCPGDLKLRLSDPEGVGMVYSNVICNVRFLSRESMALPVVTVETAPAEETLPETQTEEIQAEETQTEEIPQETGAPEAVEQAQAEQSTEGEPSAASAVPEEGQVWTEAPPEGESAPAETVTETVPETVPETVAETVLETEPPATEPPAKEPVLINGKPLEDYQINRMQYHDVQTGRDMNAKYLYLPMEGLTVEIYMAEGAQKNMEIYEFLGKIQPYGDLLLPILGGCLLVFVLVLVYLCTAAGRMPRTDAVQAGGLNRVPLDAYLCAVVCAVMALAALCVGFADDLLRRDFLVACCFLAGCLFVGALLCVGFLFALAAQWKTPGGFLWKNTLFGHMIGWVAAFSRWLEKGLALKCFPRLGRGLKKLWNLICRILVWSFQAVEKTLIFLEGLIVRFCKWVFKCLHRFLILLPLTWQWLFGGGVLVLIVLIAVSDGGGTLAMLGLILCAAIVIYVAQSYGVLAESTRRMSQGDLDTKVDEKMLIGCFRESAADLNALADVAVVAAQKQLRSERMKTELITNVSHDIKTPLTSIINYVDLLQKPHTEEEGEQYLEVLQRQSQRLKKLIDDLMDMSKANTGNMVVEVSQLDAIEAVNQALGEFADKLDKAQLIPVFRHSDGPMPMMGDGKLVWRVMSNLLGNAVKYAMPGTRLYIDLVNLDGKVVISLKNISREELNVDAEELMERFVRGDDSRNTEGSGLGLNIAKSLMELQKGQLQLLVDGDLFKVTLMFPGVE